MKVWEICKKENVGKIYIDDKEGVKWKVEQKYKDIFDLYDNENDSINYYGYGISELAEMDFEEVVDWGKVSVDTKILISGDNKDWDRRHFAKYEDGKIYTWIDGCTSFTTNKTTSWKYAKLYKEEEE